MTEETLSLIKLIGTLSGIVFGLYQWIMTKKNIQKTNANLWALFKKQQNNYGMTQTVLRLYKERHHNNIDKDILEWAAKAESFDQHIFEDIMKHIYQSDKKLTLEKISDYQQENKISPYDKSLFEMMINEPKNLTYSQRLFKWLGIPI